MVCLCLFNAIYGLETVVSVLFPHVACTFAELLEKIDRRANKKLADSSNMVKSGYATMIKLSNELSNVSECMVSEPIFREILKSIARRLVC